MRPLPLRSLVRRLVPCLAGCALLLPTACEDGLPPGLVSDAHWRARQLDYLVHATEELSPGSPWNVMAHMQRDLVDPTYTAPVAAVPADAWDASLAFVADLNDTSDFRVLGFSTALFGYRGHPMVAPELFDKLEQAILHFKFWYTQPTPDGVRDDMWYWSENHQAIFHALEYIAGQEYPDVVFPTTGMTGREHMEHAEGLLLSWFDLTARYGFREWHSNVYYNLDIRPMLFLLEFADDPAMQARAAMVLDLLFFDLATHTFRGSFGVTHGRSYKKDKMTGLDDDTWDVVKLVFDTATYDYQSRGSGTALSMARSTRYQLPQVLLDVARDPRRYADRQRMGLPIDEFAPLEPDPEGPAGFSFSDPEDLPVFWGMGALTVWQAVPLTLQTANTYELWETDLFRPFAPLRDLIGNDPAGAQMLARNLAHLTSFGLLKEVNTYVYRTPDYMLSSAQDYRKGSKGSQYHAWQATLDANAQVFTNHPGEPVRETLDWRDDGEPGFWTGEASMPRSAQHENVAIHLYAPQYASNPLLGAFTMYEPYTHAYFPQDHFDEVVTEGPWTIGRKGDGYVGLYSWRPTEWVAFDPDVIATNGMQEPFELRAPGGPDNVWIVECGRREDAGTFGEFRAALAAASVDVTAVANVPQGSRPPFFEVVYESPSQGTLEFSWTGPLRVRGDEVPIGDYRRYESPWARKNHGNPNTLILDLTTGAGAFLDFRSAERQTWRQPPQAP